MQVQFEINDPMQKETGNPPSLFSMVLFCLFNPFALLPLPSRDCKQVFHLRKIAHPGIFDLALFRCCLHFCLHFYLRSSLLSNKFYNRPSVVYIFLPLFYFWHVYSPAYYLAYLQAYPHTYRRPFGLIFIILSNKPSVLPFALPLNHSIAYSPAYLSYC